jgi:hypothetical protein
VAKQERNVIQFLKTGRGIPFGQMLAMTEYPADVMPLYAQGHSVCEWLIEQKGPRAFVQFVESGLKSKNWEQAIKANYGYDNTQVMQTAWNDWVKAGRPDLAAGPQQTAVASSESVYNTPIKSETVYNDPLNAVCRIDVAGDGSRATGTLVDKTAVLTNWHLFRDSSNGVTCTFGQVSIPGKVFAVDRDNDLAMIRLSTAPAVQPMKCNISDNPPTGKLSICGYSGNKGVVKTQGTPNGFWSPTSPNNPNKAMKLAGAVTQPGDSGDPVIDSSGAMVGINWGNTGSEALVCVGRPLVAFFNGCGMSGCCGGGYGDGGGPMYGPAPPPQRIFARPSEVAQTQQVLQQFQAQVQQELVNIRGEVGGLKKSKQDAGDYATRQEIPVLDLTGVAQKNDIKDVQKNSEDLVETTKTKLQHDFETRIADVKSSAAKEIERVKNRAKTDAQTEINKARTDFEAKLAQTKKDVVGKIPEAAGAAIQLGLKALLVQYGLPVSAAAGIAGAASWLTKRRLNSKLRRGNGEGRDSKPFRRYAEDQSARPVSQVRY